MIVITMQEQHPTEVRDHSFSFELQLALSETISSVVSCSVSAGLDLHDGVTAYGGVTKPAPAISGPNLVVWLSGGTAKTTYVLTGLVLTSGGRRLAVVGTITITNPLQQG